MKISIPLILVPMMLLWAETVIANDIIEITEWPVPWKNTRPRDPHVDSRGRVWFVGQQGDYIAYFTPMIKGDRRQGNIRFKENSLFQHKAVAS